MYKVYYDEYLLHDLTIPEEYGYFLKDPILTEEVNKVAELTFTIYDTHPNFDKLEKLIPNIIVKKGDKTIFKGRIIKEIQTMDNSKQVTCESVLAFLFDSVVRPYEWQGSPADLFTNYINLHNAQVEDYKRFVIGLTTGSNLDNNEYINRSNSSYTSSYDEIEAKLLNIGGYIYVSYEEDGYYINWVDDFTNENGQIASAQTIEFGENLIDIAVENDGSETYSVVIPLGTTLKDEEGNDTEQRLDITSINDGKDYLVNEDALEKYGWIVAPIEETTWDDVTLPENLKRKGQDLLDNQGIKFKSTLELQAIDLNVVDKTKDSFEMHEYIKVQSTPHNLSKIYLLTKKETPLTKPDNMLITLGETKSTLTGMQLGESQAIKNEVGKIKKDYLLNEAKINSLASSIKYFSVDLSQYNLTIPTASNRKPLETSNYDINFYAYFKGQQVTPSVSISGSNVGITTSTTSSYIRFSVNKNLAITSALNRYTITFKYVVDGETYTLFKVIDIALALQGEQGIQGEKGKDGEQGPQGEKGADGTGVNILGSYNSFEELEEAHPTGNIGDAYLINGNMYVWNVENNTWENVGNIQGPQGETGPQGPQGEQGIQGATGKDGTSYYFYVRYSANANGSSMTTTPQSDTKYMGVASTTSTTAPTSASGYTWSKIKGEDGAQGPQGEQGIQGQTGADGKSSYLHIKYSNDGTTFTSNSGEDIGRYRGELVDNNVNDSTNFNDYKWYDMALIVEEELEEIRQEVTNNTSLIEQTEEQIRLDVSKEYVSTGTFDEYKELASTQLTQTSEDWTFQFNKIISQVTNLDGTVNANYNELIKYIRFVGGTITLGEESNPIKLILDNDILYFEHNGTQVAYINNKKLYITNGHFLESCRIGKFAFIPRENGSLDFKKVGD